MGIREDFFGFESRSEPLLGRAAFALRMAGNFSVAMVLVAMSLFGGMLGYHILEKMAWIDAFANAAMILSGMGPLDQLHTWGGKLFAGLYALYSGLLLVVIASIVLAPVVHRVLHKFHIEAGDEK